MRYTAIRNMVIAVATVGLFAAGCAKKAPEPVTPPPAPAPSTTQTPVPAPATTTPVPVATPHSTATVSDLQTVYFALDSWTLDEASHASLDADAKVLRDNADMSVRVEGHCDERGTVEYNMTLGQKRAESVRDYLVGAGVSASRLTTISYGKERPASDGHDEAAWSKNRRAEFSKP